MAENVILVDKNDNQIGLMPKMQAHIEGQLHRAFSVFIFNSKGELLLQQRALDKYHSGGKWTNTCCSHPRLGESNLAAANRRLKEEMGISCTLYYGFNFIYKADVNEGILEHEFDHVYFGISDALPQINKDEVSSYRFASLEDLKVDINKNPDLYTEWLKICFDKVLKFYPQLFINGNVD
ncbi:isopentenyl-diphosphate Delta-isomerase [Pedobacter frigiditerrae]|uniref:isopentenyl-diphosphate Delta-isomerase n=1 Tax=Pedobacter frigiditerrae TaxID=2530452 RepID=UPI0029301BA2|nr:isopentenyl-diphosphate Delta-isomerase [Pedobacter frigiditerrae]